MQRFTEDYYVYKKNNAYHFQAINPNIPHNSYDWSNLVRHEDSNEVRYVVDGENHGVKGSTSPPIRATSTGGRSQTESAMPLSASATAAMAPA